MEKSVRDLTLDSPLQNFRPPAIASWFHIKGVGREERILIQNHGFSLDQYKAIRNAILSQYVQNPSTVLEFSDILQLAESQDYLIPSRTHVRPARAMSVGASETSSDAPEYAGRPNTPEKRLGDVRFYAVSQGEAKTLDRWSGELRQYDSRPASKLKQERPVQWRTPDKSLKVYSPIPADCWSPSLGAFGAVRLSAGLTPGQMRLKEQKVQERQRQRLKDLEDLFDFLIRWQLISGNRPFKLDKVKAGAGPRAQNYHSSRMHRDSACSITPSALRMSSMEKATPRYESQGLSRTAQLQHSHSRDASSESDFVLMFKGTDDGGPVLGDVTTPTLTPIRIEAPVSTGHVEEPMSPLSLLAADGEESAKHSAADHSPESVAEEASNPEAVPTSPKLPPRRLRPTLISPVIRTWQIVPSSAHHGLSMDLLDLDFEAGRAIPRGEGRPRGHTWQSKSSPENSPGSPCSVDDGLTYCDSAKPTPSVTDGHASANSETSSLVEHVAKGLDSDASMGCEQGEVVDSVMRLQKKLDGNLLADAAALSTFAEPKGVSLMSLETAASPSLSEPAAARSVGDISADVPFQISPAQGSLVPVRDMGVVVKWIDHEPGTDKSLRGRKRLRGDPHSDQIREGVGKSFLQPMLSSPGNSDDSYPEARASLSGGSANGVGEAAGAESAESFGLHKRDITFSIVDFESEGPPKCAGGKSRRPEKPVGSSTPNSSHLCKPPPIPRGSLPAEAQVPQEQANRRLNWELLELANPKFASINKGDSVKGGLAGAVRDAAAGGLSGPDSKPDELGKENIGSYRFGDGKELRDFSPPEEAPAPEQASASPPRGREVEEKVQHSRQEALSWVASNFDVSVNLPPEEVRRSWEAALPGLSHHDLNILSSQRITAEAFRRTNQGLARELLKVLPLSWGGVMAIDKWWSESEMGDGLSLAWSSTLPVRHDSEVGGDATSHLPSVPQPPSPDTPKRVHLQRVTRKQGSPWRWTVSLPACFSASS